MRQFLITLGLITVVVGIVTIVFSIGSKEPVSENSGKYAERISAVFGNEIDPCQDFNLYACAKSGSDISNASGRFLQSAFKETRETWLHLIKSLLEDPQANNEPRVATMAKQLYNNCMSNTSFSSFYSDLSWLPLFSNEMAVSQWPITEEQWNQSEHSLENLLAQMFASKHEIMFSFISNVRGNTDGEIYELTILGNIISPTYNAGPDDEMIFDIKPSPIQSDPFSKGYIKNVRSHNLFNSDALKDGEQGNPAIATKAEFDNIHKFRNEFEILLEASTCDVDLYDGSGQNNNSKFTLDYIQTTIPQINWTTLLHKIYDASDLKEQISFEKISFNFPCFEFFRGLGNLIEEAGTRTASNYLLFHSASKYLRFIYKDLFESFSDSLDDLRAKEDALRPTRWMNCARIVKDGLPLVVAYLHQQKHPKISAENSLQEITDYLKKAFQQLISNQVWIPAAGMDQFKRDLNEKLTQMKVKIDFPKELINATEMDEMYDGLFLNESTFLLNFLKMYQNQPMTVLPIASSDTLNVGAAYDASENIIVVRVGLLHYPVYDEDYPMYLKFAHLGFTLAHEMAHGFDNYGLLHDKDGNKNNSLWPEDALNAFRNQSVCFVDQYGKFQIPLTDKFVDGNKTLDENLSDNAALPLSWMAYEMWARDRNVRDESLPGLNLTIPQIFHIAFAQLWCESPSQARSQKYIRDVHSPFPTRVLGVLQNSPNFGHIFVCPAGTPMNPVHKCSLWS